MTGGAGEGTPALVVGRSLLSGGAEKQSVFLTRALDELGGASLVCLYTESDARMLEVAARHGVTPIFAPEGGLLRKTLWLARLVRERRVQLLLATLPVTNLVAGIAGLVSRVDVVGGFRNSREPRRLRLLGTRVLQRVAFRGVIANSRSGREFLVDHGFDPERVRVVPNAIEPAAVRPPRQDREATVRVITVARMVDQKDYPLSLAAFAEAHRRAAEEGIALEYHIVGYGDQEPAIRARIARDDLAGSVRVHGRATDVREALDAADIFLSTARYDGIPNAMMEAMEAGLPVVTTPAGDAPILVRDATTGLVSGGREPTELAGLLLRLARSADLRRTMGEAGRRRIEEEYGTNALRERLVDALAGLELRHYRLNTRSS